MKQLMSIICGLLLVVSSVSADTFVEISESRSPDGQYALAWGIGGLEITGATVDEMDPGMVENYLVRAGTGEILALLETSHFETEEMTKNHSYVSATWRDDSRAVLIVEQSKWAAESVTVGWKNDRGEFDLVPIAGPLDQAIRTKINDEYPDETDIVSAFNLSYSDMSWFGDYAVDIYVLGEIPRGESEFFYEGTVTAELPPAIGVYLVDAGGSGSGGPDIMSDGAIGGFRIGMSAEEVEATASDISAGRILMGVDEVWEAYGQAVQEWHFPEAGLSLDMISDEIGGPKSVLSISADSSFEGSTERGIGIGSSRASAADAYADYPEDGETAAMVLGESNDHIVGSVYGGLIFSFENGTVTRIFLGAAAE